MANGIAEKPISIVGPLFAFCVTFWAVHLVQYLGGDDRPWVNSTDNLIAWLTEAPYISAILTILSGFLFLVDLLCVLWWYARYIYIVEPTPTLPTHLLDFTICAMFASAANAWDQPTMFTMITAVASGLLLIRFYAIYHGDDATDTDKLVLRRAMQLLIPAFTLALIVTLVASTLLISNKLDWVVLAAIPGIFSLVGIVLTWMMRHKIHIAASLHETRRLRFQPTRLIWPKALGKETKDLILRDSKTGLNRFNEQFQRDGLSLERLPSRVHAEADLFVQAYILAVPSREKTEWHDEIAKKAYLVGLSHWLDDMFDGRDERHVVHSLARIRRQWLRRVAPAECGFDFGIRNGAVDEKSVEEAFDRIFEHRVRDYTDKDFYPDAVKEGIRQRLGSTSNRKFIYFGMVRVAAGAAMFSMNISRPIRERLIEQHNEAVQELVRNWPAKRGQAEVKEGVTRLLERMDIPKSLGQTFLALTTKTSQEIAMSSEQGLLDFPLSVVYSVLYVPLLYFHDIDIETATGEMMPLDSLDVDFEEVIDWLEDARDLLTYADDERRADRALQMKMAFDVFKGKLPEHIRELLIPIYSVEGPKRTDRSSKTDLLATKTSLADSE